MSKILKTSNYYRKEQRFSASLRSMRPQRFLLEQALKLRKRVVLILIIAAIIFVFYLIFYSANFRITEINVKNSDGLDKVEATNAIKQILNHSYFIFPQNNYFALNKSYLNKKFREKYVFSNLEIDKQFPHAINVNIIEKLNQIVLISDNKPYLLNLTGLILKELPGFDINNSKIPAVYDLSNTNLSINEKILNPVILDEIFTLAGKFKSYELPVVEIQSFRVDSLNVNYFKLVAKQGFEIHFNTILPLEEQISKLKRSLASGKIDLSKITYINLRIADQVIYK